MTVPSDLLTHSESPGRYLRYSCRVSCFQPGGTQPRVHSSSSLSASLREGGLEPHTSLTAKLQRPWWSHQWLHADVRGLCKCETAWDNCACIRRSISDGAQQTDSE